MNLHSSRKDSLLRVLSVAIGVAVSVILSYVGYKTKMPLFFDTVGTIGVAAIVGAFHGIITAVLTELLSLSFNPDALYFNSVNALVAIFTAWFVREKSFRKLKDVTIFILSLGVVTGVLSGLIQWGIFGRPQDMSVMALIDSFEFSSDAQRFALFLLIQILLNTVAQGLAVGIAVLVRRVIPIEIRNRIKNSVWRQRPLTSENMRKMDSDNSDIHFSVKSRMTLMFFTVAFGLTIVMVTIGVSIYFDNAKRDRTENARDMVEVAAEVIDPEMIDEYIKYGREAEGYNETYEILGRILKSSYAVRYLYVVTIDEDYVTFVFDVDFEENENGEKDSPKVYEPGEKAEIEDAFKPYMSQLLEGKEIEPIESNDQWNWIQTIYHPVYDSKGNCVCYVGADVSLEYVAGYIQDTVLRVVLVLGGFFILIVAYGLWTTGIYLVYPLESMVAAIKKFTKAGTEQKDLDEAVRNLRKLDVVTEDEVEQLYHAVCDMASNQIEQFRSIRNLSENTAKMQDGLIITMADLVENRDSDTGAHIQKTAAYVKIIVEGLKKKGYYAEKLTPQFMSNVVRSAPLHDIGKINIPDRVLNKPGKLTDEEYEIMKTHTTAGMKIMENAIDTVEGENYLKEARNMAAYHHERWDGKGYPEGLHGEVIPLSARIMAVADVFDALTSPRVYKPAFSFEQALSMLQEGSGTQFDPKCIEVFMDSLDEVKVILRKYN